MTNFNLLPLEYRKTPITTRRILLIALLIIIVLVIINYGFVVPIRRNREAYQKLTLLKEESKGYPDLDEVLVLKQSSLEELEQQLLDLQEIDKGNPQYWQKVLEVLIESLPHNADLNNFTCDNNTILLSGTCSNDRISATYIRNLNDSGLFLEVRIMKIIYQQADDIHFTIQCILNTSATDIDVVGVKEP